MVVGGCGRKEVLCLYISLLRTSRKFSDYNLREYVHRRTVDAFRHNKNLSDQTAVLSAYQDGISQLQVAKRQSILYSLYPPTLKSIMET